MSAPAQKQERFHFLDGLRGIAASMIVVHHALSSNIARMLADLKLPSIGYFYQNFTQSGVDLFFVLSGVVLLRPYLRGQRHFAAGDYFYRRLKRIYPPYFFALLFAGFVIWVNTAYPTWYNEQGMRNIFTWLEMFKEAFIISFHDKYYNLAWWSLGIEILFYILVPLILLVFPRQRIIAMPKVVVIILATLAATFLLQVLLTQFIPFIYSYKSYFATIGRFAEYPVCFLMGVFLASRDFSLRQGWLFFAAGLATVILGLYLSTYTIFFYSLIHSGFGVFYAGVITLAFQQPSFKRVLGKPVMVWLGERSYSLFLIHFSVFYLANNLASHITPGRNLTYALLTRGLGIPFALFMAMLLFWFVERRQARGLLTGKTFWPWNAKKDMEKMEQTN